MPADGVIKGGGVYQFSWLPGGLIPPEQRKAFAALYSAHYGVWGSAGFKPGQHVTLTPKGLSVWLTTDSHVVWATFLGEIVGYAIAIQSKFADGRSVAWVTQLVVHEEHRNLDIGKRLLFSIWKFTNHSAWGVLSANPYAIRALEKATRRRCAPLRIKVDVNRLLRVGRDQIDYVKTALGTVVTAQESRINTSFFLDHSHLNKMLANVQSPTNEWTLGPLPEGWEWFAFTFKDQEQISITPRELSEMMTASDQITHEAFSRMRMTEDSHKWAGHSQSEVDFIVPLLSPEKDDRILDFGCGVGRHSIALAQRGKRVKAVDYVNAFIDQARSDSRNQGLDDFLDFQAGDCRTVSLGEKFSFAICLYDVIGSYAEPLDNLSILKNLCSHLKPGGKALISVMNLELTKQKATKWFKLVDDPDALLSLPASNIMEQTGNIFDPEYYMVDSDTDIIYRKEQFVHGDAIPEEMIVRDRRYTLDQISSLCTQVGLEVIWARRVHAGDWETDQPVGSARAKEILLLCQMTIGTAQQRLF